MRKLCPNFDREDGLETVLEVPIPEEIFASNKHKPWQHLKSCAVVSPPTASSASELQFLLGVVGAPLIPLPIPSSPTLTDDFKNSPIERSMAKDIVQQYIAAAGGTRAEFGRQHVHGGEGENGRVGVHLWRGVKAGEFESCGEEYEAWSW